ncbi:tryptophan synthase subunit beta [Bacillus subtilis]|uniref:tryptophan synthase subunit beta n=1 Tax=Bacillus TaxID=1386 RepID=UPI0004A25AD8|nr:MULTISPECIES: tryptophan synthase subunit beta [Bacillus]MBU2659757.1 tryptophan synthase subunit beta [Bacillus cabrialesii]MEC2401087.1 tryptophan synthase subunit beta [Bacillus subtilis]MEC3653105.1 tryptophan synthase subunit beta [Bacillus subtilis]MED1759856.1 tryptophan synthase subunit beta [Bacillus subtilis]MED4666110.1 tryptophan synthase subunit beta [Bacillus subtilis]
MNGLFGEYGGAYVAETLVSNLNEFERSFERLMADSTFIDDYHALLREFVGRPTPLTYLKQLSTASKEGPAIYLKREDLTHTGAHKINNALGQALMAKKLGKERIVAETGAGQHGVAVATVCSFLNLNCVIYMGAYDAERQRMNVQRMKLLGADVKLVHHGTKTLKDAINEAIRDWVSYADTTHYLLGSAVGPHPFPSIVRHFQSIIGKEAKEQMIQAIGGLPDYVIACVGGGSNAIGMFSAFLEESDVKLIGVQAGGAGLESGHHASPLLVGKSGIVQGMKTYVLQDNDGQILETKSIAPGLDYPGVGPEHSYLKDSGRVEYTSVNDQQALDAFQLLSRKEGIIPALESSHAVAKAVELAKQLTGDKTILVNLSGRGDKDLEQALSAIETRQKEGASL